MGTGIVAAARSDESIGAENTATAFPVSSAAVLRIPQYHRTLSCNSFSSKPTFILTFPRPSPILASLDIRSARTGTVTGREHCREGRHGWKRPMPCAANDTPRAAACAAYSGVNGKRDEASASSRVAPRILRPYTRDGGVFISRSPWNEANFHSSFLIPHSSFNIDRREI